MKNIVKLICLVFIAASGIFHSCKKEEIPTVSTTTVTNITGTTATSGGTITNGDLVKIVERGICWSKDNNPAIDDDRTIELGGTASFTSNMSDLNTATTYYVRAYATNEAGTGYGKAISFTTLGQAPTAATQASTNVTANSATLNGVVNANYVSTTVTFEYGPTTSYGQTTTATESPLTGNSNTNVTVELTGLAEGTTYHFRVKAVNYIGAANGNDMSFTTSGQPPAATTQSATNVAATSATLNGLVNANYASTTVTFDYGTTTTYGSSETAVTSPVTGNINTSVSANISGLNPGTIYHYRIKAVSSLGTAFGDDMTLKTLGQLPTVVTLPATDVQSTTATLNGIVNANYLPTVFSFEYGLSTSYDNFASPVSNQITGFTDVSVSINLTGLPRGIIYHYRVKATNWLGTTYGDDVTFTASGQVPTVTTTVPSSVTNTTALSGGTITSDGGATVTLRGVCWSTSENPTVALITKTTDGTGTGTFTSSITGLTANTTYHVRAYATNSIGTAYGSDLTFTANQVVLATLTTTAPYNITRHTASSGGNISSAGGGNISTRGVCWSATANPTTADNTTADGSGTGSFSSSIAGLEANTYYHVRAYAVNEAGTAYGNDVRFETAYTIPTVTTNDASNITFTTATSGGNVLLQGGEDVTAKGVCWNTTGTPTIIDSHTTDGAGLGSYTSNMTGLTANTTYYVRAYATNIEGTAYGNETSFKTLFPDCGTVTDADGNTYNTVIIGTQCWTAENLEATHFNDGTPIPSFGYKWYNNDSMMFKPAYGALYTFGLFDIEYGGRLDLCPTGWHIPSDNEWTILTTYLGGNDIAGSKLKEMGLQHWSSPNSDATNETGFTALPGGYFYYGTFHDIGNEGRWWTSSGGSGDNAYCRIMSSDSPGVTRSYDGYKSDYYSIRCVKD